MFVIVVLCRADLFMAPRRFSIHLSDSERGYRPFLPLDLCRWLITQFPVPKEGRTSENMSWLVIFRLEIIVMITRLSDLCFSLDLL